MSQMFKVGFSVNRSPSFVHQTPYSFSSPSHQVLTTVGRRSFGASATRPSAAVQSAGGFNVTLTDEQREIQELARKFAREEILPKAQHHDETGEFPWDIVKKAHGLGLMNGHIPADCGGMGLGVFDTCLVTEELAFGCTGITLAIEGSSLGVSELYSYRLFDCLHPSPNHSTPSHA